MRIFFAACENIIKHNFLKDNNSLKDFFLHLHSFSEANKRNYCVFGSPTNHRFLGPTLNLFSESSELSLGF